MANSYNGSRKGIDDVSIILRQPVSVLSIFVCLKRMNFLFSESPNESSKLKYIKCNFKLKYITRLKTSL